MHTNLAAAAALGAHRRFRCFVPRDTWCRMEPQPRLWYSSGRYVPTLGGCVALTWWVAHIMSGNDVPIIRATRVALIWFNTKDSTKFRTCIAGHRVSAQCDSCILATGINIHFAAASRPCILYGPAGECRWRAYAVTCCCSCHWHTAAQDAFPF